MTLANGRSRRVPVSAVAIALAGVLAVHGLEAAFIHEVSTGPTDLGSSRAVASVVSHLAYGGCDLDAPEAPAVPVPQPCLDGGRPFSAQNSSPQSTSVVGGPANRALLTALSILRL